MNNVQPPSHLDPGTYEKAFAHAPIGDALVGSDGSFLKVNPALCRLTGYPEKELLGLTFQDITHPDDLEVDLRLLNDLVAGRIDEYSLIKRYIRKDGVTVSVQLNVVKVNTDDGYFFISQIQDVTTQQQLLEQLAWTNAQREATLAALSQGVVSYTEEPEPLVFMNAAASDILGVTGDDYLQMLNDGSLPWESIGGRRLSAAEQPGQLPINAEDGNQNLFWWQRPGGTMVPLRVESQVIPTETGTGFVVVVTDISDELDSQAKEAAALQEMHRAKERFEALVEKATDAIVVIDAAGDFSYLSPVAERLFSGWKELNSTNFMLEMHPDDVAAVQHSWAELLETPGAFRVTTMRLRGPDGEWIHVESAATNHMDDPAVRGVIANMRDVTDRIRTEERIAWQAYHDVLTDLPNRAMLTERLEHALARRMRTGPDVALLFLDLDRFKHVNDHLGHDSGDQLLRVVADRLRRVTRETDTVARIGGDEFVVLLEDLDEHRTATLVVQRILMALRRDVRLGRGTVRVSTSIGIAHGRPGQSAEQLLDEADTALFRAKAEGRDRHYTYGEELRADAAQRDRAETLLREALTNGGACVHYQPVAEIATGNVRGIEALLRIPDHTGALSLPANAIDVAAEFGLLDHFTKLVIEQSCETFAALQRQGTLEGLGFLALNATAASVASAGFAGELRLALDRNGLVPEQLIIEISASSIGETDGVLRKRVVELRQQGFNISLDQYGLHGANLQQLAALPVTAVKVDRSLVGQVHESSQVLAMTDAMIRMCSALGVTTVAVGVEREEQAVALAAYGTAFAQGHFFSGPVPAEQLAQTAAGIAELCERIRQQVAAQKPQSAVRPRFDFTQPVPGTGQSSPGHQEASLAPASGAPSASSE
jgi:diguanylate cyclase (GGDEF)-like protein/PAS domain S-box-containing protein